MNITRTLGVFLCTLIPMLAALSADSLVSQAASSKSFTESEQEVWQRELDYWEYRTSGKIDEYMALWHERFLGWPVTSPMVGGKKLVRERLEAEIRNTRPGSHKVRLEPISVRLYGDTSVVFYRVLATRTDTEGKKIETHLRVTHTWLHKNGKWEIIAGMSADEPNKQL